MIELAKGDMLYAINMYNEVFVPHYEEVTPPDNSNFKEVRLIIKKLAIEMGVKVPIYIRNCRTIDEAVDSALEEGRRNNAERAEVVNFVSRGLNQFIDYIEEKQISVEIKHIEMKLPEDLTYESIVDTLSKCESRIESEDYPGAITSAKTLVEGVCKEILNDFPEVEVPKTVTLPQLFSKLRKKISLDPKDDKLDKELKEVISGLINVVSGISQIRNKYGDAHASVIPLKEHHALVVVNAAKTVVTFLFGTYEYQKNKKYSDL